MSQRKLHCGFAILILLKEMLRQDFCDYHFYWSPLFFVFISSLIMLEQQIHGVAGIQEVLQSSPSSKLNVILYLCFFGSVVLVVEVISSGCYRQVESQQCNTKDAEKEEYPHQKTWANQHPFL